MAVQLSALAPNLWTLAQPLSMLGTQVGTRTTVIRLPGDKLWIHSPGPELPGLYRELRQLGEVAFVVAPNAFHHMFLPQAARLFPEAQIYGPRRARKKHPRLQIAPLADASWGEAIEAVPLQGLRMEEWAFYHHSSRSLILTDLLFNLQGQDWPTRLMLTLEGASGKLACTRLVATVLLKDRRQLRQRCEQLLQHPIERLLMCHGETVEAQARQAFAQAMAWTGLTPGAYR